jgi:hypothetical protein
MTAAEDGRQLPSQSRPSLRGTPPGKSCSCNSGRAGEKGTPHLRHSLRLRRTAILSSRVVKNGHHLSDEADGL